MDQKLRIAAIGAIAIIIAAIITGLFAWISARTPTLIAIAATQTAEVSSTPSVAATITDSATVQALTIAEATTAVTTSLEWIDDFDDGVIDPTKWLTPTNSNAIYEGDGVLNFIASRSQDQQGAEITVLPEGRSVQELSFTIALLTYEANVSGAAGLRLLLTDGRTISVVAGPSQTVPHVEFNLCPTPIADYPECAHSRGPDITPGTPISMRVSWSGEDATFYIGDVEQYRVDMAGSNSIAKVQFYMFSDPGSAFHITIDDVRIIFGATNQS